MTDGFVFSGKKLLRLTFNLSGPIEPERKRRKVEELSAPSDPNDMSVADLEVGFLVSGVVQAISNDGVTVLLQSPAPRTPAFLPSPHLSDVYSFTNELKSQIRVGSTLDRFATVFLHVDIFF
jgi:hypothetical protein